MFALKGAERFATAPGVEVAVLAMGERMLLIEVKAKAGARVPPHRHPYEQLGYVARGKVKVVIGGVEYVRSEGQAYAIPSDVEHEVEALEDSTVVEAFSPPREDFAGRMKAAEMAKVERA